MKKRWSKWLVLVGVLVLIIGLFLPLPFYLETPGTAENLNSFVRVDHKKDQRAGKYMLTTVALQQARPITYLWSKTQPFSETISKNDLMGNDSSETFNQLQTFEMQSAINDAIQVAYKKAGHSYQRKYLGIYVMSLMKRSQFNGKLAIGDTVTMIDGHHFKSSTAFINYVKDKPVGTKVTVTYRHKGQARKTTQRLIHLPNTKRSGLGITLVDHSTIKTKIPVKVTVSDIGGPSAGLMFTTAIYDQLTGGHLRRGRKVAGTGTMAANGTVGPIGGIDKKVVAANHEGATIFFAPDIPATAAMKKADPGYQNNYQVAKKAAKRIHSHMKIVPVKNFTDVVNYLAK
ncbi:SepM family pheromone-processing serine protease [Loigolactobacillus iwatensis]|uniref:SepM family pheromone-processing serine protease n=1 Tax=Loigolactobacillus iwatensis TaxID=1267156 RepID=UPI000F7D6E2E|nr:SepM family pheromone-processing serine protease [Loigolactobacillus iwatensis]